MANNIRFYTPEATDEAIQQAIQLVGLDELVKDLPEGIQTLIGEKWSNVKWGTSATSSVGPRLCRSKKRHVLLFDEPTAHLDIETEVEMKERMLPLMNNHLVFFATHRLHWMEEMDYIFSDGKRSISGTRNASRVD